MDQWENVSAFGDYAELEHVLSMLEDYSDEEPGDGWLDSVTGESSTLVVRLNMQADYSKRVCESVRPGLYERTWIADVFRRLFSMLYDITERPAQLKDGLGAITIYLHKVLIAAHEIYDERSRKALFAVASEQGKQQAVAEEKAKRSRQSADAVKSREDQKRREAFLVWGRAEIAKGVTADTVDELQGLAGFNSEWSAQSVATLKKWAKEAGFNFKPGRPKNKK